MDFIQKNRVILSHIGFWMGYYMLMTLALLDYKPAVYSPTRVLLLTGTHASLAYANMWVFVPLLFFKKRYLLYLVVIAAVPGGFYEAFFWINQFVHPIDIMDPPSRYSAGRLGHLAYLFVIIAMSTGHRVLRVSESKEKELNLLRRQRLEQEKEASALKNENLETELKFLKSQINPHFLFNALNNIYTLAYIQDKEAPEMILKLSDMLRYILYDCASQEVPIDKEINYLQNYIELQQLKTDDLDIKVMIDEFPPQSQIAPMLFIPFIENSFKHSKIEDIQQGWIEMSLSQQEDQIHFRICNSKPQKDFTKDKVGGIGLQNVKRRLELLYPHKHQLLTKEDEKSFEVDLTLDLV